MWWCGEVGVGAGLMKAWRGGVSVTPRRASSGFINANHVFNSRGPPDGDAAEATPTTARMTMLITMNKTHHT